jgi:hypothetical protein
MNLKEQTQKTDKGQSFGIVVDKTEQKLLENCKRLFHPEVNSTKL